MYFYNYLKKFNGKEINIFIDMDGVIADYDILEYNKHKEEENVYQNKRPITSSIEVLKKISKLENVNLHILSVSRKENQIEGKKIWLSQYMDFISKDNINIIPRDTNNFKKAYDLKKEFLEKNINKETINILIDDSHQVLKTIYNLNNGIIPLHITSILD